MWDDKPFREELEKLGEAEVKSIIARGDQWVNLQNRVTVAQLWLREKWSRGEMSAISEWNPLHKKLTA